MCNIVFADSQRATYASPAFGNIEHKRPFQKIWLMWCFHVKCSSICMPRYLLEFSLRSFPMRFNCVPFMEILNAVKSGFMWDGRMTMYFVLISSRHSLLAQNQVNMFYNCSFAMQNKLLMFECEAYKVVSSAKDGMLHWQEFPMSFT